MLLGGCRHGYGEGVHASLGEVHARDRVHVGDDRVDRECVLRCESGVHRLEAEEPLGTGVVEVLTDLGREPAESADGHQFCQVGREEIDGRVDVGVDEVAHLIAIEPRHEVDVAAIARCLGGGNDARNLVGHRIDVGVDVERRAIRVEGAIERLDRHELEPVVHVLADGTKGILDEVGHREHCRPGVEGEAGIAYHPRASAGHRLPLEHRHSTTCAGQPQCA